MAQLTKADAARQLGIARSILYKLLDQGRVSPTPDGRALLLAAPERLAVDGNALSGLWGFRPAR